MFFEAPMDYDARAGVLNLGYDATARQLREIAFLFAECGPRRRPGCDGSSGRRLGVVAALILRDDLPVAGGTGVGRQDGCDRLPLVRKGARLLRTSAMALEATDSLERVAAAPPLRDDSRSPLRMTGDALHALGGERGRGLGAGPRFPVSGLSPRESGR